MNRVEIPIVFSTDHNFVMQTGVCLLSLLMNAVDEYYDINILIAKDVTNEDKQKLIQTVEPYPAKLNFVCMDDTFANAYEIRNISTAAYYRLLIPWLLPQYDKVIYADVDVIFQIGLKEVYEIDLRENYVAGVKAIGATIDPNFKSYVTSLELNFNEYINSGFLVINSAQQRVDFLKQKFLEYSKNKYLYQDQDIINIVCEKKICFLPKLYNVGGNIYNLYLLSKDKLFKYYTCYEFKDSFSKSVIHYAGINKPWNAYCFQYDIWWYYYRRSVFFDIDFYLKHSYNVLNQRYNVKEICKIIMRYIKRKCVR